MWLHWSTSIDIKNKLLVYYMESKAIWKRDVEFLPNILKMISYVKMHS